MRKRLRRLALIGGGTMGEAFARGLTASGVLRPRQIIVAEPRAARRRFLAKTAGVRVTPSAREAAGWAGVVLLAIKPQQIGEVLREIRSAIGNRNTVISIVAGIPSRRIESGLRPGVPVIRVMPNTPALLRAGVLAYCAGRGAGRAHVAMARRLLAPLGDAIHVPERWMDAVTALSGSGPAYVFHIAEALTLAGRKAGLPGALAERLAIGTIIGAGRMLVESGDTPSRLREQVTSKGGTTEAALRVLARRGLVRIMTEAVKAAARRARQLSR